MTMKHLSKKGSISKKKLDDVLQKSVFPSMPQICFGASKS